MNGLPQDRLPGLIQTAWWFSDPLGYMRYMRKRHGEVFVLPFVGGSTWVMVSRPDVIRDVFAASREVLHGGEGNEILRPVVGDGTVLLLDEDAHMRRRQQLMPAFHGEHLDNFEREIEMITDETIDTWRAGEQVTLSDEIRDLALQVIMRVVFGLDGRERADVVGESFEGVSPNDLFLDFVMGGFARRMRILMRRDPDPVATGVRGIDEVIYAEISRRRRVPDLETRTDIFSMLIRMRDEDGVPMFTTDELRDETLATLIAGHETLTAAIAWTIELLLRDPDAMARARAEVESGGTEYMDAVIRESMRVRTVVPVFGRMVAGHFEIDGEVVEPGTFIGLNALLAHSNPDSYPEPERFMPERFIGIKPDPNRWFPFGGGVRRCVGSAFALMEMRVVMQTLLRRVEFDAARSEPEKVARRGVTLKPKHGVPLDVRAVRPGRTPVAERIAIAS